MSIGYSKADQLNVTSIKKYEKKGYPYLKRKAQEVFNKWIRERDRDGDYFTCIACGQTKRIEGGNYHAGHYYSAGEYNAMRFDERNCHGECIRCNYYSGDHLIGYAKNLQAKIGKRKTAELNRDALISKREVKKWTRFELINIIEKYKT